MKLLVVAAVLVAACSQSAVVVGAERTAEGCADVIAVDIEGGGTDEYRFNVTVRSADTGWEKYADAWHISTPDGQLLGERILTHPHVDEQPFTRSLSDVVIPPDVEEVVVSAHDLVEGNCGETIDVVIPDR